jgi:hypothetical protein
MYNICGTRGVRHYFHSMELYTDTLPDVSLLLKGSTSDERANMIAAIESRFPALLKGDHEDMTLNEVRTENGEVTTFYASHLTLLFAPPWFVVVPSQCVILPLSPPHPQQVLQVGELVP